MNKIVRAILKSLVYTASIAIAACIIFVLPYSSQTYAAYDRQWVANHITESVETAVYINGRQIVLRVQTDDHGELYFALRGLMEKLGYRVDWNASDFSIDMTNSENSIHLKAWDANCEVNGETIELDAPVFIEQGYSYIHQSFLSDALGLNIARWRRAADSSGMIFEIYLETDIDIFWDNLVSVPENHTGHDLYWRYIEDAIMEEVDYFIDEYGADVLFAGLESYNEYSQYYCINRLVEQYNHDEIRERALAKIEPFLGSANETIRHGAEFAVSVLSKSFDSPFILDVGSGGGDSGGEGSSSSEGEDGSSSGGEGGSGGGDGSGSGGEGGECYIFSLFNGYSDYGSYNELWMIKDDKLSKLFSFGASELSQYIDTTEPLKLSPDKNKLAVQTCSRRSSSVNIIDLEKGEISPEIMLMALDKVAAENEDYVNTYTSGPDTAYAGGEYCWGGDLKWLNNDVLEFEAKLAYNYGEIIEQVIVRYNAAENSLETRALGTA